MGRNAPLELVSVEDRVTVSSDRHVPSYVSIITRTKTSNFAARYGADVNFCLLYSMHIAVLLLAVSTGSATLLLQRRALATVVAAIVANKGSPQPLMAIEAVPVLLTDQEMAARVARKMELLRQQSAGTRPTASSGSVYEANIRSDFNPDAAVSLRSRSFVENAKASLSKQQELKTRDKKQKRDDMCEMLGRGC